MLAAAVAVCTSVALSQRFGGGGRGFGGFTRDTGPRPDFPKEGEFHFIRLEYTDLPQLHRGFGFASRDGRGEGSTDGRDDSGRRGTSGPPPPATPPQPHGGRGPER